MDYTLEDGILSGDFKLDEDKSIYAVIITTYLVDLIGQFNGYKAEEMIKSLADERILDYSFEKEGLLFVVDDNNLTVKVDVNKKIPLLDFSNIYVTVEDLEDLTSYIKTGSAQANRGYVVLYTSTLDSISDVYIMEKAKNTSNSYNSLASVLEVMFGSKAKKYLSNNYKSIEDGDKSFAGIDIKVNYKLTEDDGYELPEKDYKVMKVTINQKKVKDALKKIK